MSHASPASPRAPCIGTSRASARLYLGVMFEGIDRLHEALRAAVAGSGEPVRKLARFVSALLEHFWDQRFFFALIHRNEYRPDDPDSREWERRRAQISGLVQHLRGRGDCGRRAAPDRAAHCGGDAARHVARREPLSHCG